MNTQQVTVTPGKITLVAWQRELSIARTGRGYTIGLGTCIAPNLVIVISGDLMLSTINFLHSRQQYTLIASDSSHGATNIAHFAITGEEASRLADWLGVDMPQPLARAQVHA